METDLAELDVAALTDEEIQSLQADQALRLLGEIDRAMRLCNDVLFQATGEYFEAKRRLEQVRNIKNVLTERARILKTIAQSA